MALGLGIGLSKLRRVGSGGGAAFTTEYQAVLDFATLEGDTLPSDERKAKDNALVTALLPYWAQISALQIYCNETSGFSSIDYKRLLKATLVNSPTFTTNQGFNSNGSSSYVNTNFNPNSDAIFGLNDNFFGVITETSGSTSGCLVGAGSGTSFSSIFALTYTYNNNSGAGGFTLSGAPSTNAYISSARQLSTEYKRRTNATNYTIAESSTSKPTISIFVCARNNGASATQFNTRKMKIFIAGAFVDQSIIETILNNYITNL